jgi:hypothetical protein
MESSRSTILRCHGEPECIMDLSALRQLRSLRWRAPGVRHFDTLCLAIGNNSERLQSLELDFIYLGDLMRDLELEYNPFDGFSWCENRVFGLARQSPHPLFPAIRELCLTQVPLDPAMARALNFDTLVSLRLRECPNAHHFLEHLLTLCRPIKLKHSRSGTPRVSPKALAARPWTDFWAVSRDLKSFS